MAPRKKPRQTPQNDALGRLRQYLEFLGLEDIGKHLEEHIAWATREGVSPTTLLERVFAQQAALRREGRTTRRIDRSGLKEQKTLEGFDWNFQPKLDKRVILELTSFEFVRQFLDLLLTGKSGTGKSHILQSLALRACHEQINVRYARCVDLLNDLYAGLADDTYLRRMKRWASAELLVIDDVGLGQVKKRDDEPTAAHALFDLIDRRHGKTSTAISSNIPLAQWGRYLGDATLASAILDRVAMRAVRINIDGPSYRQHLARGRAALDSAESDQEATP